MATPKPSRSLVGALFSLQLLTFHLEVAKPERRLLLCALVAEKRFPVAFGLVVLDLHLVNWLLRDPLHIHDVLHKWFLGRGLFRRNLDAVECGRR